MTNEFLKINSKEYWEKKLKTEGEMNAGRLQTKSFGELTLQLLPDWMHEILKQGVSIVDIGCAEGDCVHLFAQKYPLCEITGVDFSQEAIQKAKKQFPEERFVCSDILSFNEKFDIVYSSNVLEHFHNPLIILNQFCKIAQKYIIILVPFQERINRYKEHFYTFEYKDFQLELNDFLLVYSKEYDCSIQENIFWMGKQILLIYKHKNIQANKPITLDDFVGDLSENYSKYKALSYEITNQLKQEREHRLIIESNLKRLNITLNKLSSIISQQHRTIDLQQNLINQLRTENNRLKLKIEKQNTEIESLKNEKNALKTNTDSIMEELNYLKKQEEWYITENYNLKIELINIKRSDFWKLATNYYKFRDRTPGVKQLYKALKIIKSKGFKTFVNLLKTKIKKKIINKSQTSLPINFFNDLYHHLVSKYEKNEIQGVAIITSAFPFDELYNQRTINLAKYLSDQKICTLFVVWQWDRSEEIERSYQEVFPHVYSIPMFALLDNIEVCEQLKPILRKYAFINIPSSHFTDIVKDLRRNGFIIIYDIMDEWEEFSKLGQAQWFEKSKEESLILNADTVTAVSQPLVDKFIGLRNDIVLIGNGYYKSLLGHPNIAKKVPEKKIHVGYFGHLTEAWFDWNLVFSLLEDKNIYLHIIGYGASDYTITKLKSYSNAKYYGKIKPSLLYQYVKEWHIGIIPFKKSALSEAVDPIKIYEYLYFGLPTVVTGIEHLKDFPHVAVSENSAEDFSQKISRLYIQAISGELSYDQLSSFLEETTWEARFRELLYHVDNGVFARLYK